MARFVVQAVHREGYAGSWRAGRMWPSTAQTEIEVVENTTDGVDPDQPKDADVPHIGAANFKRLQDDQNLRVIPKGDPMALARASSDVEELRRQVERLTLENQHLKDEAQKRGSGGGKRRSEEG